MAPLDAKVLVVMVGVTTVGGWWSSWHRCWGMKEQNTRAGIVALGVAVLIGLGVFGAWLVRSGADEPSQVALVASEPPPPVDISAVYDPFAAGDPLPDGFRQLLDRDQIEPVYDPQFTTADQVDWPPGSLVLGVEGTDTAKAYPITHLNQREMVIDNLDGMPILVSW